MDYQYVKLVDGTLDSTAKIPGDATSGLWVNVKTIAAGSKVILTDGTDDATISVAGARKPLDTHLIDAAGNVVSSFGGAGGTSGADDADFTPLTTLGTPVMGVYEPAATSVTADDMGIIGIDQNRRVRVSVDASSLDVAHDAVSSGSPVYVGGYAVNAMPAAVANGDRSRFDTDLFGRQLVAHIDPGMQVHKNANYTTTQTGTTIWDPTSGKRIAITSIVISSYGTTAGRVLLWAGDNADVTYTAGTDQLILPFNAAPSSTAKPGIVFTPQTPVFITTVDRELHITTDAAISLDIVVEGYEY